MIMTAINYILSTISSLVSSMNSMYITGNVSIMLFITVAILVPLVLSILFGFVR